VVHGDPVVKFAESAVQALAPCRPGYHVDANQHGATGSETHGHLTPPKYRDLLSPVPLSTRPHPDHGLNILSEACSVTDLTFYNPSSEESGRRQVWSRRSPR